MKKSLFLFLVALFAATLCARSAGRWRSHASFNHCTYACQVGDVVYAVAGGSFFSYRPGDTEVRTYSRIEGMSDAGIEQAVYCPAAGCFFLVYGTNNIDVFYTDETLVNLPQYKNSNLKDKTIHGLSVSDTTLYMSTAAGLLPVDLRRMEFGNLYPIDGSGVRCAAQLGSYLFASTVSGRLYRGRIGDNLFDAGNWTLISSESRFQAMGTVGATLYASTPSALYTLDEEGRATQVASGACNYFNAQPTALLAGNAAQTFVGDANGRVETVSGEVPFLWLAASSAAGRYWAACDTRGLCPYTLKDGAFGLSGEAVTFNTPAENFCYYLSYTEGNRLLVAGGSLNYLGITYPGTLMYMDEDGRWTNFQSEGIAEATGLSYINLTSVAQDPSDPDHHFASSARHGLYEFRKGRFTAHYDYTNSPLASITGIQNNRREYVSTDGLTYDAEGNLWMLNNQTDTLLRVRLKGGGWRAIYSADLAGLPTCEKLLIDSRGRVWVTSRRATNQGHRAGVFQLDYGTSISSTRDDRMRFRSSVSNQDGTPYTFSNVYALAEDLDGRMWVGTDLGPFVIDDADRFLAESDYPFTQIKIPRNDGTDYADYLLSGTAITAIAIDGGGQKWFGTASGVYVMSADGLTTVAHFTTDNSPLPSNVINSIAIRRDLGTVMIGTDKGLIAYESGIRSAADKLDDDAIFIYPNPVRPDYTGPVTVTGLTADCDVKITTAGGQLVAAGTSVGGTFTWDGCDMRGKRVATGVYFVLAATANGSEGAVGRIVVVK